MKRFSPLFYSLAALNFLFFLGNSLFILLPVFLKNLGASESTIGIMNNADKVFAIIGAVSIGSLMRGRDRVRLLRLGYLILTAAYASYLLIASFSWWILVIRMVHGIGFSLAMILGTTMVFETVRMEDAAEAIGIYGVTGALSNAISPFIGEMLLSRGCPYSLIFAISAGLVFLSLVITFFLPWNPANIETADSPPPDAGSAVTIIRNPRYRLLAILTLVFGGGFGVIITYLPNFIRTTTSHPFSIFFLVYIGVLIVIRFTLMRMVNRINRNMLIASGFVAGGLTNLLLNYISPLFMIIVVSILYGMTHGILYPVLNATMVGVVEPHDRGGANALFTAVFNGGMMLFALSLGFLIDYTGTYLAAFNLCAVLFILAIIPLAILTVRYGSLDVRAAADLAADPGPDQNL